MTRVAALRRHKYLLLLSVLVSVLLVESTVRSTSFARQVLVPITMGATLLVVFSTRWERWLALTIASIALAFNWSQLMPFGPEYRAFEAFVYHALRVVFPAFAVTVILRNLFSEVAVTGDQVIGTVCGYLLAAASWANVYVVAEMLMPGAFHASPELAAVLPRDALFYYFSLVTLTTMGYGDVTPANAPATVLAALEAIFGQFYIAVVVAQLVGLRLAQALAPRDPAGR